ncbi:MAG: tRNA uridine-5-carboxymethylaminomethyl(34) synthesis GTPase MnmE, partial [Pseudomonadota bacterium]
INLSAQTGEGVGSLLSRLEKEIISTASPSLFPRERQARLLELCEQRLRYILDNPAQEAELLSEDIRLCVTALDQLVGRISTEDVLGSIFSSFCIGK